MINKSNCGKNHASLKWFLAGAGLVGSLPLAFAQSSGDDEEVFELSPFVVDASGDTGYRATQTLAGGRTATQLKDIGTSVEVVTKEFLNDIGANDVEEYLQYTTGGEVGGSQGNFEGADVGSSDGNASSAGTRSEPHANTRLRGIGRPDYVRNYYKTNIPADGYNTSRVDINRGANSFLFGLGQPAGLINTGYTKAEMKDLNKVEFQIGSGGDSPSYRGSVDFNRVLVDNKLAFRFAALADRREYRQNPSYKDSDRYYGAITFKPFKDTTIRAHIEDGEIMGNAPDTLLPTQAFDTFVENRTPVDFFDNIQRFGDPEGPDQEQWDALTPEEQAQYSILNQGGTGLMNGAAVWGYAVVYDGSNGSQPSFAFRPQIPNAQYEKGNVEDGEPGDPFWSPNGGTDGSPSMMFWRNQRNRSETNGAGPAQGFTTLDGFDFSKQNFGGSSDFYSHDFRTYNVTLEQLFFNGQVGVELGYDFEEKDNESLNNFNGWKGEFLIDVNKTIPLPALNADGSYKTNPDGSIASEVRDNPNYGRPLYVTEPTFNRSFEERETLRATLFAKFDFKEKFGDSNIMKWFGKHTMTLLGDEYTEQYRTANMREQSFSDDFNIGWHINNNSSDQPASNYRALSKMVYMGPAVQSYMDDPFNKDTPINMNDILISPSTADLLSPAPSMGMTYWSLGPDAEGSNWTHNTVEDLVNNYRAVGENELTYEPDDFLGDRSEYWADGNVYGGWEPNTSNNTRKTVVSSMAINLQSMFFNNHLVTNVGYREDKVENWLATVPPEMHELAEEGLVSDSFLGDRSYTVDPEYFYPELGRYALVDKGPEGEGSLGYGGVFHLPKDLFFFRTPDGIDLSVHYNTSKNFVADASRNTFVPGENYSFETLASPIGEGEDFGFTVNLGNKLTARFNWFETSVQNNVAQGMGSSINGMVSWAITTRLWAIQDLNDFDPDRNGIIDVNADGDPHWRRNQDFWDIGRLHTVIDATDWVVDDGWVASKEEEGYLTYRLNGTAKKNNWFAGLQDTEERVSTGMEMNMTYNPTSQWRIAFNVSKTESVSSNVAPLTTSILDHFFESYNEIQDFHLWNPADTRSHTKPFKNWFGRSVNNYFAKKLQEGSTTNEVRKWQGSFVTNYRFVEGGMKGFSVGGAVRYQGAGAIGYPLMEYEVSPGVILNVPDVSSPYNSDYNLNIDVNFGYRKKIFENKIDWDLRLHLKNINNIDSDNLTTFRVNYDGTPANVRWDPPFDVRLTSSFKF